MRSIFLTLLCVISMTSVLIPSAVASEGAISRIDGFLLIWRGIGRMIEDVRETPFIDLLPTDDGGREVRFAKARGIIDAEDGRFRPHDPLTRADALLWLLRTRSIEPIDHDATRVEFAMPAPEDVPALAEKYSLGTPDSHTLSPDELVRIAQTLDSALASEIREASLYSEKFHGKGTAFGEIFDMHALTAAHRTFPGHTLVRVTNVANNASVIVRINDRGPYVRGRDIDLSLAAFTSIADRSSGHIDVTLQRLGDARIIQTCADSPRQRRIARGITLSPGIPHQIRLGDTLRLRSNDAFVIRDVIYPDGVALGMQEWITPDEVYTFTPSILGTYRFIVGIAAGRQREMRMTVVECGGQSHPMH